MCRELGVKAEPPSAPGSLAAQWAGTSRCVSLGSCSLERCSVATWKHWAPGKDRRCRKHSRQPSLSGVGGGCAGSGAPCPAPLPLPSWQPLSSAPSQPRSSHSGVPAVIGGFCCPVSSADCHPTCAPGNTPSSSGLGFWGSGSPPP